MKNKPHTIAKKGETYMVMTPAGRVIGTHPNMAKAKAHKKEAEMTNANELARIHMAKA